MNIRCKNPHPRLVGKPCNAMLKIGVAGGQALPGNAPPVWVECGRCKGMITINFSEAGTEAIDRVSVPI